MFYYIDGSVTVMDANLAVIDCGGVGYALHVTAATLGRLEIGKKARLYTYCNIKEDAFDIYGFYDTAEKRAFEMLLTVSGVGPKMALSVLSAVNPEGLAMAVVMEDEKAIVSAPGVGKRIAQRIILELKDKMTKESVSLKASGFTAPVGTPGTKLTEATAALTVLGYSGAEITSALRSIDVEAMTVEEIVKAVLKGSLK